MNFDFSEEQYSFRDSLRVFLADHAAAPGSDVPHTGERLDRLWTALAELGVFSILVPEQYEGLGLGFVDLALVLEEFGADLVSPAVIDTLVATDIIVRYGTALHKAMILPRIASGRARVAVATHEANAGYDVVDMKTALHRRRDRLRLDGDKILVPEAASADFLLILGRGDATVGGEIALIERTRAGVGLRELRTLDLSSSYHEVSFSDVTVSDADMLSAGTPDAAATRLLDASALAAAALMTGIAGKVFDKSVEYVKQRVQFGRPVGSFQAIKHRCADMAVAVEASRSAAYYAAWAFANESPDRGKAISIAKSFCGDTARFVCNEGTQLHGGMGFTWSLGLHFYLRRAKLLEYTYGDATHHRKRVLAGALAELGASG
jgi:alkylation response protein AidB-like acyl-CoA dehydrogenase